MKKLFVRSRISGPYTAGISMVLLSVCQASMAASKADQFNIAKGGYGIWTCADAPTQPNGPGIKASPFTVVASSMKPEYPTGTPVELRIVATNDSKETAQLQFSSGQRFDFSATKEGEKKPSWTWSTNRRFTQSLSSQQVEPGESVSFDTIWPNPKPGVYTVVGALTANGGLHSPSIKVTVK